MRENNTQAFFAEVIEAGRITIPVTLRKVLGIRKGDWVKVIIEKTALLQEQAEQVVAE